jgi:cytochrome P450
MAEIEAPGTTAVTEFLNPKTMECPYPFFEALRQDAPVYKVPNADYFIVSRFADVQNVLRRHDEFSSAISHLFDGQGEVFVPAPVLNVADPPIHGLTKPIALRAFGPNRVNALDEKITGIVDNLIDRFIDKGEVELLEEFARPLPMTVIADQLGIPIKDLDRLALWSDQMLVFNNPAANAEDRANAKRTLAQANVYLMDIFHAKRINPTDDVISTLATATTEPVAGAGITQPRPLTDAEALSMIQLLLVGGNETTTNTIGNGMLLLMGNPTVVEELRAGTANWESTIEEFLRLESPVRGFWRLAVRDTEIAGVPIAKGQMVFLSFASSNRDPAQFANPTCLDPNRQNTKTHLAFGHGIHLCVGFRLARKELGIAFRRLFERMDNIRLMPGKNDLDNLFVPTALVRGLKNLHLTFQRARSSAPHGLR